MAETMVREPRPEDLIKGQTGDWEIILGLEVHAQVSSKAKLFSGSSTKFGAEQNTQVSFVDRQASPSGTPTPTSTPAGSISAAPVTTPATTPNAGPSTAAGLPAPSATAGKP